MLSRILIPRGDRIGISRVLLPALLMAGFLTGGRVPPQPFLDKAPAGCRTDVAHPLEVRVVPTGPMRPGGVITAQVEITSRWHLDELTIRVTTPADVRLLSTPAANLGLLRAGEARSHGLTLIVPRGKARRVVQIRVEGMRDGVPITRGAVLNIVLEDEPYRIITTPDGRRVREVPARRIG